MALLTGFKYTRIANYIRKNKCQVWRCKSLFCHLMVSSVIGGCENGKVEVAAKSVEVDPKLMEMLNNLIEVEKKRVANVRAQFINRDQHVCIFAGSIDKMANFMPSMFRRKRTLCLNCLKFRVYE